MEKIDRRKFLKWMGLGAATVTTGALVCDNCAMAYDSKVVNGKVTGTRCPHRYCKRYQPPDGGIKEEGYDLYTHEEGYCLSKAFKGLPRV